jgi:hypothetical protein
MTSRIERTSGCAVPLAAAILAARFLHCRESMRAAMKVARPGRAGFLVAIAVTAACSRPSSAELSIELAGPIVADPAIVITGGASDGGITCIGGWIIHAKVRIREIGGVDVALGPIEYRFADAQTGVVLVSDIRDGRSLYWLDDPKGIPAHGEVIFDLGNVRFFGDVGSSRAPGAGPVVLSGTVNADDGTRLAVPFVFTAPAMVTPSTRPPCASHGNVPGVP